MVLREGHYTPTTISKSPNKKDIVIRGELIMSKDTFETTYKTTGKRA